MNAPAATPLALALRRLATGASLTADEAADAFGQVMRGEATPAQVGALLLGLRARGETADEVAGAVRALRAAMTVVPVAAPERLVDTCGTGGGTVPTFNISTAAAFVVAGAGVPVAKHGNRSFTSRSGSADVLEALGVPVDLAPEAAAAALAGHGFAFLFAPRHHPAMRYVGPVRQELGVPTIMNLLGPLANPARAVRQVVGVADRARAPLVAGALARLGAAHALVVHADVGMDEASPAGTTAVWEVQDGAVRTWTLDPASVGLAHDDLGALAGGEPAENAARVRALLDGAPDPAGRAAVLLNAALALVVAGRGWSLAEAAVRAAASLDGGAAAAALTAAARPAAP
ncbi:MAG: anthranilate phosphoribosyltransferase [Gemmatimonadales bacterium]|nr:anthranilate phosphoribosyltransferase [Gemmatimonadales bacterium]